MKPEFKIGDIVKMTSSHHQYLAYNTWPGLKGRTLCHENGEGLTGVIVEVGPHETMNKDIVLVCRGPNYYLFDPQGLNNLLHEEEPLKEAPIASVKELQELAGKRIWQARPGSGFKPTSLGWSGEIRWRKKVSWVYVTEGNLEVSLAAYGVESTLPYENWRLFKTYEGACAFSVYKEPAESKCECCGRAL
jgi:hypothetical protein